MSAEILLADAGGTHTRFAIARAGAIGPHRVVDSAAHARFADAARDFLAASGARPGRAPLWVSDRHPTVTTLSAAWAEEVGRGPDFRGVRWRQAAATETTTIDKPIGIRPAVHQRATRFSACAPAAKYSTGPSTA